MKHGTKIEWTHVPGFKGESLNPLKGVKGRWHCTKVSEGCQNCYAEAFNRRLGGPPYQHGADEIVLDEEVLAKLYRWKKPRAVFMCSMTDLFHGRVSSADIAKVFDAMAENRRHLFLIVTKRIERARAVIDRIAPQKDSDAVWPLPNVWLGVTAENQEMVNKRVLELLETSAALRFVSIEPMLGAVTLIKIPGPSNSPVPHDVDALRGVRSSLVNGEWEPCSKLDWVILGGESGPRARHLSPTWFSWVVGTCNAAGTPVFVKQFGTKWAKHEGADFKGADESFWPPYYQGMKEFPEVKHGGL